MFESISDIIERKISGEEAPTEEEKEDDED